MKAALYARFSTDLQREESIDDQLRVAERLAKHHGFEVVARFSDAAISGGTATRPGYQSMLEAARRREFVAIIAEDTSRLWRNLAEQAPRLAELADLGIEIITHDLDTRLESAGILGAVLGASSEAYRREIARRTRRGLEGLARNGKPTGGRSYGYVSAAESGTGQVEIHEAHADVVQRIFKLYANGLSPRAIAALLNEERVPSPGSERDRTQPLTTRWSMSAIAGSVRDGLGILNNPLYIGQVVWNRFKWVRSATDSSRRRRVPNPKSEWIVRTEERLRIVPQGLWDRVKARQRRQTIDIGDRVKLGLSKDSARRLGRGPKFVFSGLLKCGKCGANYIITNATSYACATFTNGGPAACDNGTRFRRDLVEEGLFASIKKDALDPEVYEEVRRRAMQLMKGRKAPADSEKALAKLRAEIANLTDAIATGALRSSPALAARLRAAETELERQEAVASRPKGTVEQLIPQLKADYQELVADLQHALTLGMDGKQDPRLVARSRAALRKCYGDIRVEVTDDTIEFRSTRGIEAALARAAGGDQQF
jgi:site-specific DNA recombinase